MFNQFVAWCASRSSKTVFHRVVITFGFWVITGRWVYC